MAESHSLALQHKYRLTTVMQRMTCRVLILSKQEIAAASI